MDTLLIRPYQGETDLEIIAQFYNDCEQVDQLGYWITADNLRQSYNSPGFNPNLDLRLWENNQGQLIAIAAVHRSISTDKPESFLGFRVHPKFRDKNLERDIIAWGLKRVRESFPQQKQIKLRADCRSHQQEKINLLKDFGFISDRYFFQMQRDLNQPLPQPQLPDGFVVRSVNPQQDAEAWIEMFNQTFIDHWNHHDLTLEQYQHHIKSPSYDPDLDLVLIAKDGTFAGFCEGQIYHYDNQRNGRNEGWINILGTRRGFRKLGLGRAMLLTGMHRLKAKGMEIALLGVDAQNPSGALKLYESVGFEKSHTSIDYLKVLQG
ncbi:MAG: GNAT family N-acetyltransferase [Microcoleaceae cyanobacterium]